VNTNFGLSFHHLGLALQDDVQSIMFLRGQGYEIGEKVFDFEQNVHLRFCQSVDMPAVELVLPGSGVGPLTPILKHYNEIMYHSCYETEELGLSLSAMEASGLRILHVSPPKPALLFGGRKVSFYKVMGFGLIEILEPFD